MTLQNAYKNLHKQLLLNVKASSKKQNAQELKKNIALLKYQKVNALRSNQGDKALEIDQQLDRIQKKIHDPEVELEPSLIEGFQLNKAVESKHNISHIDDVANFLSYQRTYQELIERYNPGLRMTQDDKIRRTAHKVGFELPEEFNKNQN